MTEKAKGELTEDQKEIIREIAKQAKELGVDVRFAVALANLESDFSHVPASDKTSTAYGPFQVNKATAQANGVDYDEMKSDRNLAIRTGLMNIVRHANNPELGGDPMRIAAAHRYGENSEYAKTGNASAIDPTLRDYLVNVTKHFPESTLPEVIYTKVDQTSGDSDSAGDTTTSDNVPPVREPLPLPVQSAITGAIGAATGPATAIAHPIISMAYDKVFGGRDTGAAPGATQQSSTYPRGGAQIQQPVDVTAPDQYTRAQRQTLGVGDKSEMSGRESQTGYQERTAQEAARRKVLERTASQAGLDVNRPLADYPDVASTKSGLVVTKDELNRQQAQAMAQSDLAEARRRAVQQLAQKNIQRVGADWQRLAASGQLYKPSLTTRAKEAFEKAKATTSTSKLPGTMGKIGMGAGAALPYSVELYQHEYPKTAAALPVASAAFAHKFPKTFGGLTALAGLLSAGYAAAHPRETSGALSMHDINPTAFINMPEENLPAFPEYTDRGR